MMMECPRCGFVQPKDQYCAKCGLDVDHFAAKPKPFFARLLQNSNFHLSLIGLLVCVIIAYIFYSQSSVVSKQVEKIFGTPIASRDAGEPGSQQDLPAPPPPPPPKEVVAEPVSETAKLAPVAEKTEAAPTKAVPEVSKVEVSYWEVPREALSTLVTSAEKKEDSNAGHAYFWKDGAKAVEALTSAGRKFSSTRNVAIENGAQLTIETPPTAPESFQFGLYFQVNKSEGKDLGLKWESTMVLPPPEMQTAYAGGGGAPSAGGARQPAVRTLTQANLTGSASPTPSSALMIVYEPATRALRDDALAKAGEGPWTIFGSYDFRSGVTEWVVLVQLK